MPENDLALMVEAAKAAGEIARRFWRKDPEVWDKGDGAGPVTEADLAINAMLHAELGRARPGYGWLSEETPDDPIRLGHTRSFIVDPIDGTRSFIEGDTSFAHSLAVAEDGKVIAAVVYLPMKDALYTATLGGVSKLNDQPIRASDRRDPNGATVLTSKPSFAAENWKTGAPPPFRREFRASLAWRLCLVAEGRFDAMLTLRPTWEWDIAAGDLIARQAGARVTDRAGRAIAYNTPDPRAAGVVAAPEALWRDLQGALVSA